ncbi:MULTISPECIES: ABC transporter permease [unclassified Beijerinckia]|uniref:ABC transporter permease n=1 Tax=unclassified Beijerinckia TaxID=2638183 RepID=UPI00089C06C7|nr:MULTISPECIES: ABC transporter permease [unclassified Beijerinckia]MDH7798978.1 NitT/TauT family transport system permease protein [Beijerinckia sp. GAS462]SED85368.1 NitT/TauT family transport system permease protein/sulfonate transport system permease protein [Beijerinckia sp. 28-YEA-48]
MADTALSLPAPRPTRFIAWLDPVVRLYPIAIVLALWEIVAHSGTISPLLLPPVEKVAYEFWRFAASGDLAFHGLITLQRALIGFLSAVAVGVLIGTALARVKTFNRIVEPIFTFGYPIPKIALYPVFIFIFGFGDASKIVLIFLECLYPITIQTMHGMRSAEKVLVWAARNYGASSMRIFWRVLVPSAAPSIFAGIRIALPISMIVTIITELIGESRGLGYVISFASASFEPARAMAAFVAIAAIGFTLDRSLNWLRGRVIHWQGSTYSLT